MGAKFCLREDSAFYCGSRLQEQELPLPALALALCFVGFTYVGLARVVVDRGGTGLVCLMVWLLHWIGCIASVCVYE